MQEAVCETEKRKLTGKLFPFLADGVGEAAFPVTALLAGALLTIGVAVLLIICLTIKKNREQSPLHENGIKEKHIGSTCGTFSRVVV